MTSSQKINSDFTLPEPLLSARYCMLYCSVVSVRSGGVDDWGRVAEGLGCGGSTRARKTKQRDKDGKEILAGSQS